jgi:hypothetical protein
MNSYMALRPSAVRGEGDYEMCQEAVYELMTEEEDE